MTADPFKVLLVEDNPGDVRLFETMLGAATDAPFLIKNAKRLEEATALLETDVFDAVILDLGLPDSSGLNTVDRTREKATENRVPIIVITGLLDDATAFDALKHGAQEFLSKDSLNAASLVRTLRFSIERQRARNRIEDDDARRRHENEMTSLENISSVGTSLVTARTYGMARLRESSPDTFELLVEQYAELVEQAVEQRAFKIDRKTSQGLRVLAQRLGFLRARPRDVVEIHTDAIKREMAGRQMRRAYVMAEEARLMLVEVMGYLAAYYRDHMLPGASSRTMARSRADQENSEVTLDRTKEKET